MIPLVLVATTEFDVLRTPCVYLIAVGLLIVLYYTLSEGLEEYFASSEVLVYCLSEGTIDFLSGFTTGC